MKVVFNGQSSSTFSPCSGVPQGSILGPLLFIIYINELPALIKSHKNLYADDIKVSKIINTSEDVYNLQADLDTINVWCEANSLSVNASKSYLLSVTNKTTHAIQSIYTIDNEPITKSLSVKDLGVVVDANLRFHLQTEAVTGKAFKMLGFVIRTSRHFRNLESILNLYSALVLPILEYASCIWSKHCPSPNQSLESVQRRFTRYLYKKFNWPYECYMTRLYRLNMFTLDTRRIIRDQLTLFDIVNGNMVVDNKLASICLRAERPTRNCSLFGEKTWTLKSAYTAPIPRMIRHYNSHFNDLDIFHLSKSKYKELLCDKFGSLLIPPD